jgi:nitronate monooxygenase
MIVAPLRTPLCELLGIRVPVLLAPMAGGVTTPELVAAVTGAGGLGSFGLEGMSADAAHDAVRRAVELGGPPVGINVLLAPTEGPEPGAERVHEVLAPFRRELGLDAPPPGPPEPPPAAAPRALVEAGLDAGASVVSVGMGDPAEVSDLARAAGAPLLAGAATADEARRWARSGADAIVAQGAEAGGHRMTPGPGAQPPPLVGTFALLPRVVDAVDVPVIAAGGVMDGRGLAAALALGAQGVAMGTRFLVSEEARLPRFVQERILGLADVDTVITDQVTGRPGRWIRGRVVDALVAQRPGTYGWPRHRHALWDVRTAGAERADVDLFPMLAGQGAGLAGAIRPAADVVAETVAEAERILGAGV